jgi:hypothetical protein
MQFVTVEVCADALFAVAVIAATARSIRNARMMPPPA